MLDPGYGMFIDKMLSRFSIQTKVIVFVLPLISGIIGLAAINFYTGSLLGDRLNGTGASIESLSGFQRAYSGMNEFLRNASLEKREVVIKQLETQVSSFETLITFAKSDRERESLEKAKSVAVDLRNQIDQLWELNGEELQIRANILHARETMSTANQRLTEKLDQLSDEIASQEDEAKEFLRKAEYLENAAGQVVDVSFAISNAQDPEAVFAAVDELSREIRRIRTKLPREIPATEPALASLITDNLKGIQDTFKAGAINSATMQTMQRYSNGLRPVGLKLRGIASQLARQATTRFIEIDPMVVRGRTMIENARSFSSSAIDLELLITEFLGFPTIQSAEELAVGMVRIEQALQLMETDDGGAELIEVINQATFDEVRTLTSMAADLLAKVDARTGAFASAGVKISDAWSSVVEFADSQRTGANTAKTRADGITLGSALAVSLISLLAAGFLVAALKGPILRLARAMRNVAQGDLTIDNSDSSRADEIGEMARALDVFKANAIDKIRIERETQISNDRSHDERMASEAEKAAAARTLQNAVSVLGKALRNLASGDLVSRIETPFEGALDTLRVDFNESVERVHETLSQISETVMSIQANGSQMQSAADDLAHRTENQAASLEQVAGAIQQISGTVNQSSLGMAEANGLVSEVCKDACKSSEIVQHAVVAMSRIESASAKIGQIIGAIDEIAFQTNLLALNAGVEAARAGDAGKGFAVVAQEVRELAGRSATAARQIKELIAVSSTEVATGVSLVNDTGQAMGRINKRIGEISTTIDGLAGASRDEANVLADVNTSVSSMDHMTQQNAAMVEQTNAASHQLAHEAKALMEMVRSFQIDTRAAIQKANAA